MRETTNMGLISNEKKEQNIIKLRVMYHKQKVVTVASAMKEFGVVENTIIKWCKAGDIPLIGSDNKPVIKFTAENMPSWW